MYTKKIEKKILKNLINIFKKNFNKKKFKNFHKLAIYDYKDWDSLKNLK